jgi:hypothetical protein
MKVVEVPEQVIDAELGELGQRVAGAGVPAAEELLAGGADAAAVIDVDGEPVAAGCHVLAHASVKIVAAAADAGGHAATSILFTPNWAPTIAWA